MASGALEITAMIKWLVAQPGVTVIRRGPDGRAMAQAAVLRSIEVPRIHPGSGRAVVAGRAGAQDLIVIDGNYRCPDIGTVAILADIGR